tara:strand:+ start:310 stop:792 length:483 start_codon:yes stop_codon:yes gene_type:complete
MSLIKIIDKNYKKKQLDMKKLLKSKKLNIKFFENNILQIFENNKKLIEAEYNFWGIIKDDNILVWANAIPLVYKQFKKNTLKIRKNKSLEKEYIKKNDSDMYFYSSILENDMNLLEDSKYIEYVKKLILYLSKDMFIIMPINSKNNLQLITISKIRKKYF